MDKTAVVVGCARVIITENADWAQRARHLTTQAKDDPIEYIRNEIGYNYRLTNIQDAMGVAQMEQLESCIGAKCRIAATFNSALQGIPGITIMRQASWARSTFWMYTILMDADRFGIESRDLLNALSQHNIQTRPLWQPIHLSHAHSGAQVFECSVTESLYQQALSLPCSVGLSLEDQKNVIQHISTISA